MGTAGRLAVHIAKHLGARKVIATGRNSEALNTLAAAGADVTIPLAEDAAALEESFNGQFEKGIDVVIAYLCGQSAERLLIAAATAGADAVPVRFIQVGSASGADITLPSAVLRASAIELMGSGIGSIALDGLSQAVGELFQATLSDPYIASQTIEAEYLGRLPNNREVFLAGSMGNFP